MHELCSDSRRVRSRHSCFQERFLSDGMGTHTALYVGERVIKSEHTDELSLSCRTYCIPVSVLQYPFKLPNPSQELAVFHLCDVITHCLASLVLA